MSNEGVLPQVKEATNTKVMDLIRIWAINKTTDNTLLINKCMHINSSQCDQLRVRIEQRVLKCGLTTTPFLQVKKLTNN